MGKWAKFQHGSIVLKSPIPELLKSVRTNKIPDWAKNGQITHTGTIEKWQIEQNSTLNQKWQNHLYRIDEGRAKQAKFQCRENMVNHRCWTYEEKPAKWAKFELGTKMAKSLIQDLCKNYKMSKIPDQLGYGKITHAGGSMKKKC